MSETKDFHFEQSKPKRDPYLTEKEIAKEEAREREQQEYLDNYMAKTEKELLVEQTNLARLTLQKTSSIKSMVTFFVWIACIGIFAWFIFTLMAVGAV